MSDDTLPGSLTLDQAFRAAYFLTKGYVTLEREPDIGLVLYEQYLYSDPCTMRRLEAGRSAGARRRWVIRHHYVRQRRLVLDDEDLPAPAARAALFLRPSTEGVNKSRTARGCRVAESRSLPFLVRSP